MTDQSNKVIVWEKWRDPFLGYDENEIDIENSDARYWMDDEEEQTDEHGLSHKKPIRVIYTPMGIIPYNEYTASSTIFNFWIGHTRFSITTAIAYIIESCDGVETLDIFTRYRFRIGIGKIFTETEVMQNITEQIDSYLRQCNVNEI